MEENNNSFLELDQTRNKKEKEQKFLSIVQNIDEGSYPELLRRLDGFSDEPFRVNALNMLVSKAPKKWSSEILRRVHSIKDTEARESLLALMNQSEHAATREGKSLLAGYSKFYKNIKPIITILWVLIFLLIIIPLFGRVALSFSGNSPQSSLFQSTAYAATLSPAQTSSRKSIRSVTAIAHDKARQYASDELDEWIDETLKPRVESRFLNWYFNYFNRKGSEYTALYRTVRQKDAQAAAVEDFQKEFSRRVLNPRIAQRKINRITREAVDVFFRELSIQSSELSNESSIPLEELTMMVEEVANNDLSSNFSKSIEEATLFTSVKMAPIAIKATEKIAIKLGAKAGVKVGAAALGEILDPLAIIGITVWDVLDYRHEVSIGKPQLRDSIFDYFDDMKSEILDGEENSIMAVVKGKESGVRKSFNAMSRRRWLSF